MQGTMDMGRQSIGKLMWQFSWPTIIAMLCSALYNIIDRAFVGHGVGSLAIAATTVAFPVMMILFSVSLLIGIGATALISIRLGEQKKEEAEIIAGNAITWLIVFPLVLSIVYLLFPEPILRFFGASSEVMPYAHDFMYIVMLGSVFGSLSFGMNNFIRAEGNPIMAMSTQILGALICGILNYIFIFKLGLGIKGSALATVAGQLFSAIWILSYYWTGRSHIKIRLKNMQPRKAIFFSIIAIGFAPFVLELVNCFQQAILNKTVTAYSGDLALSAIGILISVVTLILMLVIGICQGAQPIMGFNYGARNYDRVKATLARAIMAASVVSVAGYLAIQIWPTQIVGIFSEGNAALTELTAHAMVVFLGMLFIMGFQIVGSQYFQAVGKAPQAAILTLSRQFLFFIPLLLILPRFWGIEGVWRTAPIADSLSCLLTAGFIMYEMKHLPKTQPLSESAIEQS
ncbi:MAG: MATE family efflux transporter [Chitinophagales bacterium]